MKKLFAVILVSVLLMTVSFAESADPIVESWYMFYNRNVTPEFADSFGAYERIISVYTFNADGTISCLEHDYDGTASSSPMYMGVGKWEHDGINYKYSIIGMGEGTAIVKDGSLYLGLNNNAIYLRLNRLVTLNPYADYKTAP